MWTINILSGILINKIPKQLKNKISIFKIKKTTVKK